MFNLSSRRYTVSKIRLLESIDEALLKHFDYRGRENLSFFDVFAGTGVVGEYFIKKKEFGHLIINDFLESNFVIYKAFFAKESFDTTKLESYAKAFNELDRIVDSLNQTQEICKNSLSYKDMATKPLTMESKHILSLDSKEAFL